MVVSEETKQHYRALDIRKQIEMLGDHKIKEIQQRFTVGDITPYEYQVVCYVEIAKRLSRYDHPFFVKASVSAGKTIIFAMVAAQCQRLGMPFLLLARQAEIVSQDSDELRNFGVPNSVFCAGLNTKSTYFPIVVGSEGTVANGLMNQLGDHAPRVLGIDECHQLNWVDLAEAIKNNEPMEQMIRSKDEVWRINGVEVERGMHEPTFLTGDEYEYGTGRSQYTIIIREMQRRCREKHGHELRIFGMTGSEFRGVEPILVTDPKAMGFWREQVTNIDTNYLIEFGSVVPTQFGMTGDLGYDLSEFKASGEDGVADFDQKTLKAMGNKIHADKSMTQKIMAYVHEIAKNRNGVLVTCADERHCKEAAASLPAGTTYRIITGKTGEKQRAAWLKEAFDAKCKYVFQVKALTTGVNIPYWDTSIILRKISSLTLLIQLLGRGMRLLKKWQKEQGMVKNDHLVLDFGGSMDELGQLYFDPILEEAQYQTRNDKKKKTKECPICEKENSFYARRCIHKDQHGNRCEHFFTYRTCEDQIDERTKEVVVKGCGVKNDVVAKTCRGCGVALTDPNANLSGKHYTINDFYPVVGFDVGLTRNQKGILFNYTLENDKGKRFSATEKFFPESDKQICRRLWAKGVTPHVDDPLILKDLVKMKSAKKIIAMAHYIKAPVRITHRINGKKEDIIARKDFGNDERQD